MKNTLKLVVVLGFLATSVFAQKNPSTTVLAPTNGGLNGCSCANLKVEVVMYLADKTNPASDVTIEFNYQHEGKIKCTPVIGGFMKINGIRRSGIAREDRLAISSLRKVSSNDYFSSVYVLSQSQLSSGLAAGIFYTLSISKMEYGLAPCPVTATYRSQLLNEIPLR